MKSKAIISILTTVIIFLLWVLLTQETSPSKDETTSTANVAEVIRVVDGDTLAIKPTSEFPATNAKGTEHVIRILGMNTPELNSRSAEPAECGAEDAKKALEKLALGKTISVTYDQNSDQQDRYGRTLAYVGTSDNPDLTKTMLETGYASAYKPASAKAPLRYDSYTQIATKAYTENIGIWGTCK